MDDACAGPRPLAPGSVRARVVIVQDEALALIERRRDGALYFVLPGGGVEPGETPEEAAAREAWEELGLRVAVGALLTTVVVGDVRHQIFLATPLGGTFGTGRGAEMTGASPTARGTYRAVWLPLAALAGATVYPRVVAALVATSATAGWPVAPLRLREPAP
jgi:8-oxo-dGTP pyrophosphatase MutT (NUDIX family)